MSVLPFNRMSPPPVPFSGIHARPCPDVSEESCVTREDEPAAHPPTERSAAFQIGYSLRHHPSSGNPLSGGLIAIDTLTRAAATRARRGRVRSNFASSARVSLVAKRKGLRVGLRIE